MKRKFSNFLTIFLSSIILLGSTNAIAKINLGQSKAKTQQALNLGTSVHKVKREGWKLNYHNLGSILQKGTKDLSARISGLNEARLMNKFLNNKLRTVSMNYAIGNKIVNSSEKVFNRTSQQLLTKLKAQEEENVKKQGELDIMATRYAHVERIAHQRGIKFSVPTSLSNRVSQRSNILNNMF